MDVGKIRNECKVVECKRRRLAVGSYLLALEWKAVPGNFPELKLEGQERVSRMKMLLPRVKHIKIELASVIEIYAVTTQS